LKCNISDVVEIVPDWEVPDIREEIVQEELDDNKGC